MPLHGVQGLLAVACSAAKCEVHQRPLLVESSFPYLPPPSPLQFCWLLVLPCTLAICGALAARREFVLRLPRGAMAQPERSWWAGLAVPPLWQILLLFMPAFSMSLYRIIAQVPPLL